MDIGQYISKFNSLTVLENNLEKIKLIDLINNFKDEYYNFKQEYDQLPKLNLSLELDYLFYNSNKHADFQALKLHLIKPRERIFAYDEHILQLSNHEGEYKAIIKNDKFPLQDGYKAIEYNLDKNIIKKYLDLFDKYKDLADAYYELKKTFTGYFSSNLVLSIKLDGNLFTNINGIILEFGISKTNFELNLDIQDDLKITSISKKEDYNHEYSDLSDHEIIEILSSIYLNKEDVKKIYIDYNKQLDNEKIKQLKK